MPTDPLGNFLGKQECPQSHTIVYIFSYWNLGASKMKQAFLSHKASAINFYNSKINKINWNMWKKQVIKDHIKMKHSETDANSFKNKWVYTHLPSIRDVSFLKIQWARTSFQALTGFVVPLHNMTLIRNNFYSTVTK